MKIKTLSKLMLILVLFFGFSVAAATVYLPIKNENIKNVSLKNYESEIPKWINTFNKPSNDIPIHNESSYSPYVKKNMGLLAYSRPWSTNHAFGFIIEITAKKTISIKSSNYITDTRKIEFTNNDFGKQKAILCIIEYPFNEKPINHTVGTPTSLSYSGKWTYPEEFSFDTTISNDTLFLFAVSSKYKSEWIQKPYIGKIMDSENNGKKRNWVLSRNDGFSAINGIYGIHNDSKVVIYLPTDNTNCEFVDNQQLNEETKIRYFPSDFAKKFSLGQYLQLKLTNYFETTLNNLKIEYITNDKTGEIKVNAILGPSVDVSIPNKTEFPNLLKYNINNRHKTFSYTISGFKKIPETTTIDFRENILYNTNIRPTTLMKEINESRRGLYALENKYAVLTTNNLTDYRIVAQNPNNKNGTLTLKLLYSSIYTGDDKEKKVLEVEKEHIIKVELKGLSNARQTNIPIINWIFDYSNSEIDKKKLVSQITENEIRKKIYEELRKAPTRIPEDFNENDILIELTANYNDADGTRDVNVSINKYNNSDGNVTNINPLRSTITISSSYKIEPNDLLIHANEIGKLYSYQLEEELMKSENFNKYFEISGTNDQTTCSILKVNVSPLLKKATISYSFNNYHDENGQQTRSSPIFKKDITKFLIPNQTIINLNDTITDFNSGQLEASNITYEMIKKYISDSNEPFKNLLTGDGIYKSTTSFVILHEEVSDTIGNVPILMNVTNYINSNLEFVAGNLTKRITFKIKRKVAGTTAKSGEIIITNKDDTLSAVEGIDKVKLKRQIINNKDLIYDNLHEDLTLTNFEIINLIDLMPYVGELTALIRLNPGTGTNNQQGFVTMVKIINLTPTRQVSVLQNITLDISDLNVANNSFYTEQINNFILTNRNKFLTNLPVDYDAREFNIQHNDFNKSIGKFDVTYKPNWVSNNEKNTFTASIVIIGFKIPKNVALIRMEQNQQKVYDLLASSINEENVENFISVDYDSLTKEDANAHFSINQDSVNNSRGTVDIVLTYDRNYDGYRLSVTKLVEPRTIKLTLTGFKQIEIFNKSVLGESIDLWSNNLSNNEIEMIVKTQLIDKIKNMLPNPETDFSIKYLRNINSIAVDIKKSYINMDGSIRETNVADRYILKVNMDNKLPKNELFSLKNSPLIFTAGALALALLIALISICTYGFFIMKRF